jgi:hypothetical protein
MTYPFQKNESSTTPLQKCQNSHENELSGRVLATSKLLLYGNTEWEVLTFNTMCNVNFNILTKNNVSKQFLSFKYFLCINIVSTTKKIYSKEYTPHVTNRKIIILSSLLYLVNSFKVNFHLHRV